MTEFEQQWIDNKAIVKKALIELIDQGFSLDVAKRLAGWNPSYEYDTWADLLLGVKGDSDLKDLLRLSFARAATRVNSDALEGGQLDAGVLYAIFIEDIPELAIDTITFYLDGVPVHTEASVPWDYDGTAFDGTANRVTFVAGDYEIEAEIAPGFGAPFLVSASFSVE